MAPGNQSVYNNMNVSCELPRHIHVVVYRLITWSHTILPLHLHSLLYYLPFLFNSPFSPVLSFPTTWVLVLAGFVLSQRHLPLFLCFFHALCYDNSSSTLKIVSKFPCNRQISSQSTQAAYKVC